VLVLALDTTTRAGSAAVVRDGVVLSQLVGDASLTHGARLPTDLMRTLELASVPLDAIDLLAVAAGPGSFTGLRVGIAAMQGLAMARSLRIVPVSALDALALAGADGDVPVAAWMDAQRGQVFAALYDATGRRAVLEATALTPAQTLERWERAVEVGAVRFIGDGAVRYRSELQARLGEGIHIVDPAPLASVVGRIAWESPEKAVVPHAVVPLYIRQPDAELAKAKLQDHGSR
jgi:tRNA threonylcarbamoyladenosine biosynthesis protein TsaB